MLLVLGAISSFFSLSFSFAMSDCDSPPSPLTHIPANPDKSAEEKLPPLEEVKASDEDVEKLKSLKNFFSAMRMAPQPRKPPTQADLDAVLKEIPDAPTSLELANLTQRIELAKAVNDSLSRYTNLGGTVAKFSFGNALEFVDKQEPIEVPDWQVDWVVDILKKGGFLYIIYQKDKSIFVSFSCDREMWGRAQPKIVDYVNSSPDAVVKAFSL